MGDEPQIQQKDHNPDHALDQAADHKVQIVRQQRVEEGRQQHEQSDGQRRAEHNGETENSLLRLLAAQCFFEPEVEFCGLLLLVLGELLRRISDGLHAVHHRADEHGYTAQEGDLCRRIRLDRLDLVLEASVREAADDGLLLRSPHQNTLDQRLTADAGFKGAYGLIIFVVFCHCHCPFRWID